MACVCTEYWTKIEEEKKIKKWMPQKFDEIWQVGMKKLTSVQWFIWGNRIAQQNEFKFFDFTSSV